MATNFICHLQEIGGTSFTFPVNPESYKLTASRNYEEVSLVGSRDIPMVGYAKLEHVSFRALLPGVYDPAYCNPGSFLGPTGSYLRLKTWATGAGGGLIRPLRMTIPGFFAETMAMVAADLSTEASQEFGDIWVEVELVKWVDPREGPPAGGQGIPTISNPYSPVPIVFQPLPLEPDRQHPLPPRPAAPVDQSYTPTRYTVVAGDDIWSVARMHYGSGTSWRRIWEANKPLLSGDVNVLTPGEQLLLPRR